MIPSLHKLAGKDIQYMLRKGKRIYGKICVFLVIPQYRNRSYHQRANHISIKVDKRATMRNMLKRHVYNQIRDILPTLHIKTPKRYRIFVMLNKKNLEPLTSTIASNDKKTIVSWRKKQLQADFNHLTRQLISGRNTSPRDGKPHSRRTTKPRHN